MVEFGHGLPEVIELPHQLPGPLNSKTYHDAADNIVAAYKAGAKALEKSEAYAQEGWDWLAEALESLGVESVFEIPTWKAKHAAPAE